MFQKVLIAEDHGLTGSGLRESLAALSIPEIIVVHYCDDALLKIKAALQHDKPFEILITDLSFKADYKNRNLVSGEELIAEVKKIQPDIKTVVYSVENRVGKIKTLYDTLEIDAFVGKERRDINEITKAIQQVLEGKIYFSESLKHALRSSENHLELDEYDILLLQLLAKGLKQEEIAQYFQERNYHASSLRSIQDRLGKLKTIFGAKTPVHLVAQAMERGFI
ncbi:response regulator [Muricauda sp. HICW]|uniref:Response regulator n=1 Tax=Flagellimonas chongwuensis TaxID=2697365 RepID=A0A850NGK6_9FLAO|nr:response regulator transcription factor [Allomuricauda chongwuensis]NVN18030.1 response regulator [Allomuricauda chongwuensis]